MLFSLMYFWMGDLHFSMYFYSNKSFSSSSSSSSSKLNWYHLFPWPQCCAQWYCVLFIEYSHPKPIARYMIKLSP